MTHQDRLESLKAGINYAEEFPALLREVAANALHSDSLIAGAELVSLYTPEEIIAAISAAEDVGLTVKEAVAVFVLLCATVYVELQKRRGFFHKMKMKIPPKPGSRDYAHLAMTNYVLNTRLSGTGPSSELIKLFTQKYNAALPE